jgi:hypothetical protein
MLERVTGIALTSAISTHGIISFGPGRVRSLSKTTEFQILTSCFEAPGLSFPSCHNPDGNL